MENETAISLRRIDPADADAFDAAWRIYEEAFPVRERRRREDHSAACADAGFSPDGIYEGECLAGLIYWWRTPVGRYIEHLAVDRRMRCRNIGSRVLRLFTAAEPSRTVLEIETPEDGTTRRRLEFYRRNGFTVNGYEYIHPSYRRPYEPHPLVWMSTGGKLTPGEFGTLREFVREKVLLFSEH